MRSEMTRAEQRALEAYPVQMTPLNYQDLIEEYGKTEIDVNTYPRRLFLEGYEQAEKDLGWISVTDRLPEEGHFVLTCVSDTGTPQCVGMAILLNDGTWWDGDMKVHVDYWMEVPQLKENNYGM